MSPPQGQPGVHILPCSLRFGEESRRIAIRAASARGRVAVRLGGGSRSFSDSHAWAQKMYDSVVAAFSGCDFTFIAGGTRMELRADGSTIPGITEALPLIAATNPNATTVGVIPRQTDLRLANGKLVVSNRQSNDHITFVHPDLSTCLLLQYSADKGLPDWDAEWQSALDLMDALRTDAGYRTLHVFYGGGPTTERELLHVLKLSAHNPASPWRVVLVADSGGVATKYTFNAALCERYADRLTVCQAQHLRVTLQTLGFGPQTER